MTDKITDRLSRISALRPAPGVRAAGTAPGPSAGSAGRLTEILGAECRSNPYGAHLVVCRRLPAPRPPLVSPEALSRILPDAGANLLDPGQWLFLDTETTGLAGGTGTYAFLVGIAWWEDGGLAVEQYFMRDYNEEPSLLFGLSRRLQERRVLVTFNGKSFDWPLLQTRYRITRAACLEDPLAHLDLLHPARQVWGLRLKSVALSELERHILDLERGSDIPSETIPGLYFDFLRGGPAEPLAKVFRHNELDLQGLAALAVHIADLLHEPESSLCPAEDLYGISRLLQRRGEGRLAGQVYQRALECGLPESAERRARQELAMMAKRQSDFERSNTLWERLLGGTQEGLHAYEQLAIYYEHRARQPERAAALSREALARLRDALYAGRMTLRRYQQWHASFQHRLNRLQTKSGRQ